MRHSVCGLFQLRFLGPVHFGERSSVCFTGPRWSLRGCLRLDLFIATPTSGALLFVLLWPATRQPVSRSLTMFSQIAP